MKPYYAIRKSSVLQFTYSRSPELLFSSSERFIHIYGRLKIIMQILPGVCSKVTILTENENCQNHK
jgi:hypothetical protein